MFRRLIIFVGSTSTAVAVFLAFAALVLGQHGESSAAETAVMIAWLGCGIFVVIALCSAFEIFTGHQADD